MPIAQATADITHATIVTWIFEFTSCINLFIRRIPGETTGEVTGIQYTLRGRDKSSLYRKEAILGMTNSKKDLFNSCYAETKYF